MDGRRAPQGLHAEDRIALGLSATHLFYLVIFSMTGWAVLTSRLPGVLSVPVGILLIATGAALAWGRAAGRPLDRWAWLFLAYRGRPRRGWSMTQEDDVTACTSDNIVPLPPSPPRPEQPAANIAMPLPRFEDRPPARRRARRSLFFSYRGGSGRTTLATEVATVIASSCAGPAVVRVALLDLDFSSSAVRLRLGLDGPDITDLLLAADADGGAMERVLLRHESGLRVVLGPAAGPVAVDAFGSLVPRLAVLLAYLDEHFDLVVIDTDGAPGDLQAYLCEAVDDIFYVYAATPAGIFDLYRGVGALRRAGHRQKLRIVLNHANAAVDAGEPYADLRLHPVAAVPTLAAIAAAEDRHVPACLGDEGAIAALGDLVTAVYPDAVAAARSGWIADVGDQRLQARGVLAQL